jgi:tryptophan 2,3-dioxygenase
MADPVACHSGSAYAEYPLRFEFQGEALAVDEVLARWRTPTGKRFRVRAAQALFDLVYDEAQDHWRVEQLSDELPISQHDEEPA